MQGRPRRGGGGRWGPARLGAGLLALALFASGCQASTDDAEPIEPPPVPETPPEPADPGPRPGGTLRIGLTNDPISLDPRYVLDEEGELIVDALFDPLVRLDATGTLVAGAARSWDIEDDGARLVFRLGDGRFHDGSPVRAEDVKRTFDTIADGTRDEPSFLAYLLTPIEGFATAQDTGAPLSGVEVVDDETVVIRLTEPDPGYLSVLSDPSLAPLPALADEDPAAFAQQPIGNGPFAMAGPREPGAFVRLTSVPDHPRAPYLDEVVLTVYADDRDGERQWTDLLDGQLQVAAVRPEQRDEAIERFGRSADGYRGTGLLDGTTTTVYLYAFDTTQPPFDDPRVRQAISLAIDREALADEVMRGTRVPADALLPPSIPGAVAGRCTACRYAPDEARALLEAAERGDPVEDDAGEGATDDEADADRPLTEPDPDGGTASDGDGGTASDGDGGAASDGDGGSLADDDRDTTPDEAGAGDGDGSGAQDDDAVPPAPDGPLLESLVLTHTRGTSHAAIAEAMSATIEDALDIEVGSVAQDLQRLVTDARAGELQMFRLGWDTSDLDAAGFLRPLFHSESVGLDNLMRYESATVDEALDAARAMRRSPARDRAFGAVEAMILDDMPVVPLLWYRHQVVVAEEVRDLTYTPLGRMDLSAVWLDERDT